MKIKVKITKKIYKIRVNYKRTVMIMIIVVCKIKKLKIAKVCRN